MMAIEKFSAVLDIFIMASSACHTPVGHYVVLLFISLFFFILIQLSARPLGTASPNFQGCCTVGWNYDSRQCLASPSLESVFRCLGLGLGLGGLSLGLVTCLSNILHCNQYKARSIHLLISCDLLRVLTIVILTHLLPRKWSVVIQ